MKLNSEIIAYRIPELSSKDMGMIGVSPEGIEIMLPKAGLELIKVKNVPLKDAIILKQEAISVGAECAVSKNVMSLSAEVTDAILMATSKQISQIVEKMKKQPFNGKKIASSISFPERNFELKFKEKKIKFSNTKIMGILNVTQDSFSDGSSYLEEDKAIEHGKKMVKEGADIIDIGGESTRPFSNSISEKEELKRVIPVIEKLSEEVKVPISIDTYKPKVAEEALKSGASMVNDITGLRDKNMINLVAKYDVPVVVMHMRGMPQNMQENLEYKDLIYEIIYYLKKNIDKAIEMGVNRDKIIIDPGIGFGKTVEHNLEIIRSLTSFQSLGYPVLIGPSRKSFIGKTLNKEVNERLEGSLAVAAISAWNDVDILRVHDVKETKMVLKMVESLKG